MASSRLPSYRLHRPSGQAVVTLSKETTYLGRYGSAASKDLYHKLVAEWIARGRRPRVEVAAKDLTVGEVLARWERHAEGYYRKRGKPTSWLKAIRVVVRDVTAAAGGEPVTTFGPLKIRAIRQAWVDRGLARETVNSYAGLVKQALRWAVAEELVPPAVAEGARAVSGLAKGRTEAREPGDVLPVPAGHLEAVLPFLAPVTRAMVLLQDLTAMRPGEVCGIRPCDLDTTGDVWVYSVPPEVYKSAHTGKGRTVLIGPRAVEVLRPWLDRAPAPDGPIFRSPRSRRGVYSESAYRDAVKAACRKAGIPEFTPNRIRHTAATRIRAEFGLEAAQVILGHSRADVTQVYAEANIARAREVIEKVG